MEHRFRLRRGDVEVEFAGERDFVEALIARFVDQAPEIATQAVIKVADPTPAARTEPASFPRVPADFQPKVNITIDQFVAMKEARAPADVFVVGVYYLEKYRRRETFAMAELQDLLAEVPSWECRRAEDVVEEVLARGHVEKLRDGSWSITFKGQNYVREGLS